MPKPKIEKFNIYPKSIEVDPPILLYPNGVRPKANISKSSKLSKSSPDLNPPPSSASPKPSPNLTQQDSTWHMLSTSQPEFSSYQTLINTNSGTVELHSQDSKSKQTESAKVNSAKSNNDDPTYPTLSKSSPNLMQSNSVTSVWHKNGPLSTSQPEVKGSLVPPKKFAILEKPPKLKP